MTDEEKQWQILRAVMLENLTAPTHSLDDDYPDQLVAMFGGWHCCAIMVWRECDSYAA